MDLSGGASPRSETTNKADTMARMARDIRSHSDALDFLAGTLARKLGHNTEVRVWGAASLDSDDIARADVAIVYHSTPVVMYHADGRVTLNTGGWLTVTTKQRLNACSPFRVWSERGEWAVDCGPGTDGAAFSDGMTSDPGATGWQEHKARAFCASRGGHAWTWKADSGPEQVCDDCGAERDVRSEPLYLSEPIGSGMGGRRVL